MKIFPTARRRDGDAQLGRRRARCSARPAIEGLEARNLMTAGPLGINATLDFVDAMKTAQAWTGLGAGPFTQDANGWPTTDAEVTVVDDRLNEPWNGPDPYAIAPDISGTYHLSFQGSATISPPGWNVSFTVQNQAYNAATNTTTADIVEGPGNPFFLIDFTHTVNPASATGAGVSNVVLIRPGYAANTTQVFTSNELNALKPFGTLRFMDASGTNNYPVVNSWDWSQRTLPTAASQVDGYGGTVGESWEYMIALANATNEDMWINIPGPATDDYVTQLAKLIQNGDTVGGVHYAGLNPNLKVYLEYSNEVWGGIQNTTTENQVLAGNEVQAGGSTLNNDGDTSSWDWSSRFYLQRTMQVTNIFRGVMGADPTFSRVRPVLGWQEGNWGFYAYDFSWFAANYGSPSTYFYGLGNAIYFAPTSYASVNNVIDGLVAGEASFAAEAQQYTAIATYYGMKNVAYEGGPAIGGSGASGQIALAASRDPRMEGIVATYYEEWYAAGGDVANFFNGPYASWSPQNEWSAAELYQASNPSLAAKYRGLVDVAAAPAAVVTAGVPVSPSVPTTFSAAMDSAGDTVLQPGDGTAQFYLVNAAAAGSYNLSLTTNPLSSNGPGLVRVFVDDKQVGGTYTVTSASTIGLGTLALPAGLATIEIYTVRGTYDPSSSNTGYYRWEPSTYTLTPASALPGYGPPTVQVIDDEQSGFTTTGSDWAQYYGQGYGNDVLQGTVGDTASWTFHVTPGTYQISATWAPFSNRQQAASYVVSSGGVVLGGYTASQDLAPSSFVDGGGTTWQNLGNNPFTVTGTTLTVTMSGASVGFLIADAVRIQQVATPATPPSSTVIINDLANGSTVTGSDWSTVYGQGYGDQVVQGGQQAGDSASWIFTLAPGTYDVAATWIPSPGLEPQATYSVASGASNLGKFQVNQQQSPSSTVDASDTAWHDFGVPFTITGTTLTVTLSGVVGGVWQANAIRVMPYTTAPAGGTQVINDGGTGFSTVGPDWTIWTGQGYGNQVDEGHLATDTASWTFTNLAAGTYEVSATWSAYSNRQQAARYTVTSGSSTLAGATFDQRSNPSTFVDAGGTAWQDISGSLVVTGSTLTVTLSAAGVGYLNANAIRLQQVAATTGGTQIINDGGTGFSTVGTDWTIWTGQGFGNQIDEGRLATDTASWTFNVSPGTYEVSATWSAYSNRQQAARYTVTSGSSTLAGATFDQRNAPSTFVDAVGVAWQDISGSLVVTGSTLTVTLSAAGVGYLNANAIRLQQVAAAPPTPQVINDGGTGFSTVGPDWTIWTGQGYGNQVDEGHLATDTASWTFTNLAAGTYEVSATWSAYSNRQQAALYTVTSGSTGLGSATVNQVNKPSTFVDAGGTAWQDIGGPYTITGSTLTITLSAKGVGYLNANAIRILKLS